jgi:hypothetical protein
MSRNTEPVKRFRIVREKVSSGFDNPLPDKMRIYEKWGKTKEIMLHNRKEGLKV